MTPPNTPELTPEKLKERIHDAQERIGWMCKNGRPPRMSIPARPEVDDDLVICKVLDDSLSLVEGLRAAAEFVIQEAKEHPTRIRSYLVGTLHEALSTTPKSPLMPIEPTRRYVCQCANCGAITRPTTLSEVPRHCANCGVDRHPYILAVDALPPVPQSTEGGNDRHE